jgi:hypothetical protein
MLHDPLAEKIGNHRGLWLTSHHRRYRAEGGLVEHRQIFSHRMVCWLGHLPLAARHALLPVGIGLDHAGVDREALAANQPLGHEGRTLVSNTLRSTEVMGWTAPTRHHRAKMRSLITTSHLTEPSMEQVTTIGLDLAKNVFQLHGVDAAGNVLLRKQLRRGDVLRFFAGLSPCLVGMEACATAHYWARELAKLGHRVRLMPPAYVKPYVKRGKTDAADAEAIAEAVTRPTMRFVAVKTAEQQAILSPEPNH